MKNVLRGLVAGVAALGVAACSGGGSSSGGAPSTDGGETTKSMTISGSLTGLSIFAEPMFGLQILPKAVGEYKVRCVTLSGPLHAGEGVVSSGAFSFSMTAGLSAPLGCFLLADEQIAAVFSFKSQTSMTGGNANVTSYAPKPDSTTFDMGAITVAGGVAALAAPPVENGTSDRPTFANMTGTWRVSEAYVNEAEGYMHPCDMDFDPTEKPGLNAACKVKWATKGIYLHQIRATDGGDERFGIALWDNAEAFQACGSKPGLTLDGNWAPDGWTEGDYTFASVDLSNITPEVLGKARFSRSVYNGYSNCPGSWDSSSPPVFTEAANCATATTCADFDFAALGDGTVQSQEKSRCVLNSLSSGGEMGYNYGNACGARAEVDWQGHQNPSYDNDGSGCTASDCGMVDFSPNNGEPLNRMFFSEMFVEGNVGNAAREETWTCSGATIGQNVAITMTQSSATAATFLVEFTMKVNAGTEQQIADCIANDSYAADSLGKVRRLKLKLAKQ